MFSFTPSLDPRVADQNLSTLLAPAMGPERFHDDVRRLRGLFGACLASCPPPWIAPGLAVTPEIHYQSQLWLPLELIAPPFNRLYRAALSYPPHLTVTPFAGAGSWAALASSLPPGLHRSANPAALLERLLLDGKRRLAFLCWSFMPKRFYGAGSDRYPGQSGCIRQWLTRRRGRGGELRCLDAGCGDGGAAYGLARMLVGLGHEPARFRVEGWTLEPLEVWAAAHGRFPHDPRREPDFREAMLPLFHRGAQGSLSFRAVDLEALPAREQGFDLIVCNGLLGGPIIHQPARLAALVRNLAGMLRPDGLLLAADHFHGGWKKAVSPETLGELFRSCGLAVSGAGEGLGGTREAAAACHRRAAVGARASRV